MPGKIFIESKWARLWRLLIFTIVWHVVAFTITKLVWQSNDIAAVYVGEGSLAMFYIAAPIYFLLDYWINFNRWKTHKAMLFIVGYTVFIFPFSIVLAVSPLMPDLAPFLGFTKFILEKF